MRALIIALACLLHDDSISSSRVEVGHSDVTVTFTMSKDDLAAIGSTDVFAYLRDRIRIWNDGVECAPQLVRDVAPDGKLASIVMRYASGRPIGLLRFRCDALRDRVKNHKHIADVSGGRTFVFEKDRVEAEWSAPRSWPRELGEFVALGMGHIVTGWDHLVFLLTLLLIARSMGRVVRLVTAFTVAHSVTLGLTALRVIGPPAGLVEAVIAASIVYVAVENFIVKDGRWRWALVFAFGLVHGMGFGGALLEMQLASPATALLGFNVGVELGQLGVVALVYPLLALLRRREDFYRAYVVRALSGAAAAAGLFWFVQRIV